MKFELSQPFTIEVGEEVYSGQVAKHTKATQKKINDLVKKEQKAIRELKKMQLDLLRIQEKIKTDGETTELSEKFLALDEKIEKATEAYENLNTVENISKLKFDDCVTCDKEVTDLAEKYGYTAVIDCINKDLEEGK